MDSGPKTTIRDLPTELYDNIFDFLGCNDQQSLSQCTLVCRDWHEVSRAHLFSELDVPRGPDESFEDLADFLEAHSTIATHVRTLALEPRLIGITPQLSLMPTMPADLLCRLVRAVPHLHSLRLRQLITLPPPREPRATGRIFVEHLEYECASKLDDALALLSLFRVDHLDFDPILEDGECEEGHWGSTLDAVSLCCAPWSQQPVNVLNALKRAVPPDMLKTFRYFESIEHPVYAFLRELGRNIVDLNLTLMSTDDVLILPDLPDLRTFRCHFQISLHSDPAKLAEHQAYVTTFRDAWLPNLPTDLEQLVLYIEYGHETPPCAQSMPLWGFEPALARFPRLKKLTIYFPTIPGTLEGATTAVAACFPAAHARGILSISVGSWDLECRESDLYGYLRDSC
ncbi:hypothetical protein C8Q74DRAFT_209489 [Fomes fomentarius]|nr:hypothetical protein C8Q74DRAFT_209489 [Fomes fomentarius]